ncbi:MAG: hypothetical protein M3O28_09625, partial [Actinomycetota bacterium]|nr:hypothetical protein [Actinomycetota bacterium]
MSASQSRPGHPSLRAVPTVVAIVVALVVGLVGAPRAVAGTPATGAPTPAPPSGSNLTAPAMPPGACLSCGLTVSGGSLTLPPDPVPAPATVVPVLNVPTAPTGTDRDQYLATPAQGAALARMESGAVSQVLTDHQLPASDAARVQTYSRTDVLAELWVAIQGDVAKSEQTRSADEKLVYAWLQSVIQRHGLATAQAVRAEYNAWAGAPQFTARGI